jgi:hypothetical protein
MGLADQHAFLYDILHTLAVLCYISQSSLLVISFRTHPWVTFQNGGFELLPVRLSAAHCWFLVRVLDGRTDGWADVTEMLRVMVMSVVCCSWECVYKEERGGESSVVGDEMKW